MSFISFLLAILSTYFILSTPRTPVWARVGSVGFLWLVVIGGGLSLWWSVPLAVVSWSVRAAQKEEDGKGHEEQADQGAYRNERNEHSAKEVEPPTQPERIAGMENPFATPRDAETPEPRFKNPFE